RAKTRRRPAGERAQAGARLEDALWLHEVGRYRAVMSDHVLAPVELGLLHHRPHDGLRGWEETEPAGTASRRRGRVSWRRICGVGGDAKVGAVVVGQQQVDLLD